LRRVQVLLSRAQPARPRESQESATRRAPVIRVQPPLPAPMTKKTAMVKRMTWMKTLMMTAVQTSKRETLLEVILPMTRASCPTVT
jgi:hypothetical protein